MSANATLEGWYAQKNGAVRSSNPYEPGSAAFRDWQEGHDQAGAGSCAPEVMRRPLAMKVVEGG